MILQVFVAGSESTCNSLDWAFLFMAEQHEIQEKCFKEINDVTGNKYIDYADRVKLPYLRNTEVC